MALVDAGLGPGSSLQDLYSRAVQQGARDRVLRVVRRLLPGVETMEILTEQNAPELFLSFEGGQSVPAKLAGDGTVQLLRALLLLVASQQELVLLEEPEAHLHSRAVQEMAAGIVEAGREHKQLTIATHSLELLDALLGCLSNEETANDFLAVYRVRLVDGILRSSRFSATEAQRARLELEEDLR